MATTATSLNVTHLHHHQSVVFGTTAGAPGSVSSSVSSSGSIPSSRSSSSTISDSGSSPGTSSTSSETGHFCKDCGVMFESHTSLEVHLSYHKENLLSRWAAQDPSNNSINSTTNTPPNLTPTTAPSPSVMDTKSHQLIGRPTSSPYYQTLAPVSLDQHGHYNGISSSPSPASIYTRPIPSFPGYNNFPPQHQQHQPLFAPMDSGDPPPRPPSNARDQKDTPAEILDLDSNKVHIYHLQQQQQQQQQHQNFYRPYLMSGGPTNNWGGPNEHPHFAPLPPPQEQPPPQVYPVMYEFMSAEAPIQRYMAPNAEPPPMGFGNNGPSQPQQAPGVPPNFRGTFPPQIPDQIPSPNSPAILGSPNPTTTTTKKQKKTKQPSGPPSITMSEDGSPNGDGLDSPAPKTKGWKGGECKRPKTYNCTACNKWFTSSGHLKRHYGTTLHKNSIKQRGDNPDEVQPPPSTGRGKGKKQQQQQQQIQNQNNNGSSDPGDHPNSGNSGMDVDSSLPVGIGTSPRNGMKEESGSGKSSPHHPHHQFLPQSNTPNGNGIPAYLTQGPGSSPYGSTATPPSYIQFNGPPYNGGHPPTTQFLPAPHPHHPFANGFGGTEPPNIYSVPSPIVPTTLYSTGPPFSHADLPGVTSSALPPFSSVAGAGAFTTTHHYEYGNPFPSQRHPNAPSAFLHQGSLGPPGSGGGGGGSPPSYNHESSSSLENNNGPLNRSSPEAARSVSSASGHLSSDGLSDDLGSPVQNGSISSGDNSSSFENEFNSTAVNIPISLDTSANNNNNNDNNNSPIIKCPNCSKTFNRSCYLTQHTNSSHSGGKPYKCPKCGKRFLEEPSLADHVAKHGTNKPYKCELCPKQFNHKTDLRRHLCLHTGEKPFVCNICGKGFIRKDHMTKHCETHRKNKGQGQQQLPVLAQ